MTEIELLDLLKIGEKVDIECKEGASEIPKSLWESYSAMANTNGGIIILGIKEIKKTDTFEVQGVKNVSKRVKDFWDTINGCKTNKNLLKQKRTIFSKNSIWVIIIFNIKINKTYLFCHDKILILKYFIIFINKFNFINIIY